MATIDFHVHLPVPEWLDGALGPYLESAERYFRRRATARPMEDVLDRAAAAFPEMPIVLAHVGWPWHLEALAMALHKTNVFIDISGWRYRYLPQEVLRDMKGRLSSQFLFGSDVPMFSAADLLQEFGTLELPQDVAAKILSENAHRLLALKS